MRWKRSRPEESERERENEFLDMIALVLRLMRSLAYIAVKSDDPAVRQEAHEATEEANRLRKKLINRKDKRR